MEVVPTGDGDDDGVVWFRCPQCQGFLPKLGGALDDQSGTDDAAAGESAVAEDSGEELPWDSPADMLASRSAQDGEGAAATPVADARPPAEKAEDTATPATSESATPGSEPVAEYAALLAEKDPTAAVPYRPWQSYEVGQCVHHLAWDDCGVVVAKEDLPGGRCVIKCYFSEAGVVRLIEQAPR